MDNNDALRMATELHQWKQRAEKAGSDLAAANARIEELEKENTRLTEVEQYHSHRGLFDNALEVQFNKLQVIIQGDEETRRQWCEDQCDICKPDQLCDPEEGVNDENCFLLPYWKLQTDLAAANARIEELEKSSNLYESEATVLAKEVLRMTPVYEAAVAWREHRLRLRPGDIDHEFIMVEVDLQNAVEAAVEAEKDGE